MIKERLGNHSKASFSWYGDDIDVKTIYIPLFEDNEYDNEDTEFQEPNDCGNPIPTQYIELYNY